MGLYVLLTSGGVKMILYAIQRKLDNKFVTGTDFEKGAQQRLCAFSPPLLYTDEDLALRSMRFRKINPKYYRIVPMRLEEVK